MYGNFHCPPSYCYDLLPTFMGVKVPLQWRLKKGKKKVSHYVDSPAIKAFLFFQHRTDCVKKKKKPESVMDTNAGRNRLVLLESVGMSKEHAKCKV